jgi:hypothetical protein
MKPRRAIKPAQIGGRPQKTQDYVVHRLANIIHIADALHENKKLREEAELNGIEVFLGGMNRPLIVRTQDELAWGLGQFILRLKKRVRAQVLRHLVKVLEGKSPRDKIAKARDAYCSAQAEYAPAEIKPTFVEAAQKHSGHLDRRTLKDDGLEVRRERRPKKLPRLGVGRNRGKDRSPLK